MAQQDAVAQSTPAGTESSPATLALTTADIKGMALNAAGGLVITKADGSTLVVDGFKALAETGGKLALADGESIDAKQLFATLSAGSSFASPESTTTAAIAITGPQPATSLEFTLKAGETYVFDFDPKAQDARVENGNLILTFDNGGTLVLKGYEQALAAANPPVLKIAGGAVLDGIDLLNFARMPDREDQTDKQANLRDEKPTDDMAALAQELAAVEPAAGEAGGGAGGNRGGFGFQSAVDAAPLGSPPPIGPLGPTALQFGNPDIQGRVYADPAAQPQAPGRPGIEVADSFVYEDGTVQLNLNASSNGFANVNTTITVSGIPATWTVTPGLGTYNPATGTWTITLTGGGTFTGGPFLSPPHDSDVDLPNLQVTITNTSTTTGLSSSQTATVNVFVDAVADKPDLSTSDASGLEDTTLPVTIATGVTDVDGSESITKIVVSGVPAGFVLSAGTDLGGGSYELTPAQLAGLTMTPPAHYSGTLTLQVTTYNAETLTSGSEFDPTNNTNSNTGTLDLTWTPVADVPALAVRDVQVKEDGSVVLPIVATLADADGSEYLTITVQGIPAGWTVGNNGGTYVAATGTWTIVLAPGVNFNGGPTLFPPADSDIDSPALTVTATSTEVGNGDSASNSGTAFVIVDAVIDTPNLSASSPGGEEDLPIDLNIATSVNDLDGSEAITHLTVSGLPAGASLNSGTDLGGGIWQLTPAQLPALKINPPIGFSGVMQLTITTYASEVSLSGTEYDFTDNDATKSIVLDVTVRPDDVPVITPPSAKTLDETNLAGAPAGLSVTDTVVGSFGSDGPGTFSATGSFTSSVPLTSNGLPITVISDMAFPQTHYGRAGGQNIFKFVIHPDGTYTFTLLGVLDHPDASNPNDLISIDFAISATDSDGDTANSVVRINILDDAPVARNDFNSFDLLDGGTNGNVVTGLNGGAGAADTTSQDKPSLVTSVSFKGTDYTVPAAGVLTINGDYGVLRIAADGSYTYTVTPGTRDQGDVFVYTLKDDDGDTSTATLTFDVDPPTILPPSIKVNQGVDDVVVKEDGSVFVKIVATLDPLGPPTQFLTVTVTGINPAWTLTNADGTYNPATGTWTITLPTGQNYNGGLTFAPPANSDLDLSGLNARATATEPVTGQSANANDAFRIITDAVADKPDFDAVDRVANENQSIDVTLNASLKDTDGSEIITGYKITGVPAGFSFNNGTDLGGGVWTFTPAQIAGLKITPPAGYNGTLNLVAAVYNTENPVSDDEVDLADNDNSATDALVLTWRPLIDPPDIVVEQGPQGVIVKEDGSIDVPVIALLGNNSAPSEYLTVTVTGINPAWSFSAPVGSYNPATGTWTVVLPPGQNLSTLLTFAPPANSDFDLTGLVATAVATDPISGQTASDSQGFAIITDAVADKPTIVATASTAEQGHPVNINISAAVTDTDGSESITGYQISGVPAGFSFNKGTDMGGGVWTFTPAQIAGLQMNGPASYTGTFSLTVRVNNAETTLGGIEVATVDNTNYNTTTLQVTISEDSVPVITNPGTKVVDETNLATGPVVVNGTLTANFFGDAPGTFGVTGVNSSSVPLTSDGHPVSLIAAGNGAGTLYTGTANGVTIFTLQVNTNGTYTFRLTGTLDHPNALDHNDVISLTFGVKATDSDGDSATANLVINVHDDGVDARDDFAAISTNTVSGNVLGNDYLGQDTVSVVSKVQFGGTSVDVPATGSVTINGSYGILTIQSNGSWTYVMNTAGSTAVRKDLFTYTLRDSDLDTDTANLEITIDKDDVPTFTPPTAKVVDETALDGGPVVVNGTLTASFGNDGPGTFGVTGTWTSTVALTSEGAPVLVSVASNGTGSIYTGTANGVTIFTLQVNTNGSYTFRLTGTLDHPNPLDHNDGIGLSFGVTATDADGDSATTNLVINVLDDGVVAVDDARTVDENIGVVNGNVMTNDNISQDTPNTISTIQFGANTVTVATAGQTTINGAYGVLKIAADGTYTYTLNPGAYTDGMKETFTYTLRDSDGDSDTALLEFTIDADDIPTIGVPAAKVVDETALDTGPVSVNGSVSVNFYGDGPGTLVATGGYTSTVPLTSNGTPVNVTVLTSGSQTILKGMVGAEQIFIMTVNNNGSFNFTLTGTLDHPNPLDHNDGIGLTFAIKATDADGDIAMANIAITVLDDGVAAIDDSATADSAIGVVTGNVMANDNISQDTPNTISTIQFGGTTVSVPATGQATINGNYGVLKISADGSYTYTTNPGTSGLQDSFTYTLVDSDGDSDTANLNIGLVHPTLIVGENVNDVPGSTTPYEVGPGSGKINGGSSFDILVGDVGGATLTAQEQDYNIVMMLDVSGSMGSNMDPTSRISLLTDAVKNLLAEFNAYDGGTIRVKLICFNTNWTGSATFDATLTSDYLQALTYLDGLTGAGFTNYEAPMQKAIEWLNQTPGSVTAPLADALNISYFISDGAPNYYLDNSGNAVPGTEAQVMAQMNGSADGTNEIGALKALSDEVIGVGINIGPANLANLDLIDSDGSSLNVDDPTDLDAALASTNPLNTPSAVGSDQLSGGDGNDIIFGDAVNTDDLASVHGILVPEGSGWEVFARLEAGQSALAPGWTRTDTLNYIKANAVDLAVESVGTGGATRAGGNDRIEGGAGDDLIFGQEGNDLIIGGTGNDVLYGGSGADRFDYNALSEGTDSIMDFSVTDGDVLDLSTLLSGIGFDPVTDAISNFVFATDTAQGLVIKIDATGSGNAAGASSVVLLDGVHGLTLNDLLSNGNVTTS